MTPARVISPLDHFGRVPENLLFTQGISGDECRLYAVLTTYDYRRSAIAGVGRDELASRTGWSLSTVGRVLRALESRGAIFRQRRGRSNENTILLHADLRPDDGSDVTDQEIMMGQPNPDDGSDLEIHPLTLKKNEKVNLEAVKSIFDAWVESTGKTGRTRLDDKRKKLITKALEEYPVEDVLGAVRGWKSSPYHRGENEQHKIYNDLGLLLRDAEHIERFRDFAGPAEKPADPKVRHNDDGTTDRFYPGSGWVRG